jgi:predicted nucleotidyltransferase
MSEPSITAEDIGLVNWSEIIPDEEWKLHSSVIQKAQERGLRFALGGGLAFSAYSHRLRNTKDLDLFILPQEREAVIEVTREAGYADYYEKEPYDRSWIYRAYRDDVLVDVIWENANHRAEIDEAWLTRGPEIEMLGLSIRLLPPEELIWSKLYIIHRERCDWPDLLNILYRTGPKLDWEHLLKRVGRDAPLLGGLMSVFGWLCPQRAREVPEWVWERMGVAFPEPGPDCAEDRYRVELIDSRDWFGPAPADE